MSDLEFCAVVQTVLERFADDSRQRGALLAMLRETDGYKLAVRQHREGATPRVVSGLVYRALTDKGQKPL